MKNLSNKWEQSRKVLFSILEVGPEECTLGRAYDILNLVTIIINLAVSILYTFDEYRASYGYLLLTIEAFTVAFFAIDCFHAADRWLR